MTALPDPDYQAEFYASVAPKRLLAWVVDSLIIFGLCMATVVMTAFVGLFTWPLLYLTIGFAYRTITIANGSATLGMRFAGIELRDLSGQRMDLQMAALHTGAYTVALAVPLLQVVSVIMMLTSARGQGLGDAILGTVMLNRRSIQR
ncbi:RDD family protein [Phaeobacter gallaeciensis]|uniref:RDD family protein n=1 Tax=Phaeobacter gallaeciensis TaxID=60890 RepID=UPI00237FA3F6|nr:RDD family protein [Phaeobacter gallaeciensis]MDE4100026.1 RDD family protein [Phaeobacter gallaeciensis]MDE4108854.1 RDD family protein [Phaeobacter gallaeciensis]MDE4113300.1 RDD family protein [Phaeobacter gallaeciensis]MDE4117718.1 RDD family protein [Phaeobacter gallaeciensis]MDE4122221.1 RDD family protein [Phaeobacter gallaeciensis]